MEIPYEGEWYIYGDKETFERAQSIRSLADELRKHQSDMDAIKPSLARTSYMISTDKWVKIDESAKDFSDKIYLAATNRLKVILNGQ